MDMSNVATGEALASRSFVHAFVIVAGVRKQ